MSEPKPGPSNACTFSSPKKKRAKKTPMNSAEKVTVINVFKHVEETWPQDSYPYKTDVINKTAEVMGISRATVNRFIKEYKTTGCLKSPPKPSPRVSKIDTLDDMDLGAIRRKVHMFYFNNELPTIDKVLEAVNSDETLPSFKRTTFYKVLKKLQFKYVKRNRKSALIDRDDIVLWRIKYLNTITKLRNEGKTIYYTDETWLNEGHTMNKVWQDETIKSVKEAHHQGLSTGLKNPSGKGKRLIVVHIGSNTGFLEGGELIFEAKKNDGDYHSEMDSYNFEKWFGQILLKLDANSVIVMDNAPYHSRRKEKIPTSSNKKSELQAWLKEKNISFEETEVKAQLLLKIKEVKDIYQTYVVDEMAHEKGITVVRLPPYHSEAIQNVATEEAWQKCIDHVIKEEQKMLKIDGIIDDLVDRFIIHVGESSSESSEFTE
ncbi:uncharacterized protein LOC113494064 [Trichoplusia ni]|uniref:Uncharacterized protein LOC113494064 n=1 Tax=Trichoplusia ni TaxID=7111 RepID=A0A7E5VI52_TRINI|nr:uncharacterized protein LOC113494064 [Trichoplusia ni]